jgi:phosphoglycerol transferase
MIGLWDQLPRRPFAADRAYLAKKISEDQLVAAQLDSKLPQGSSVFQLPVVPFLEQPPVNGMTDYELFRPWFFSVSTNFSYGLLAGEKALRWEKWIAGRPVGEMCESLEKAGYAAIYLNKKAYPDAGAALRHQLIALGHNEIVEAGDHLAFALHPSMSPALPDVSADWLADSWTGSANSPDELQFLAEEGWFGLERDSTDVWRWAGPDATLSVWNPASQSVAVNIEFSVATLKSGQMTAAVGGRQIWKVATGQMPNAMVNLPLTLQPGANRIHFHFTGPAVRPSPTDRRLLGFRVVNLHLSR